MTDSPAVTHSLAIEHLSKRYAGTTTYAIQDLSLHVEPGEVYGFLGSNGAGKSTTIRLLLGFLRPTSGTASIMNNDIVRDSVQAKRHIGYLSGDVALYPKVTGRELFAYMSKLQGLDTRAYLTDLIARFEADPDKPIGQLSKGNRQKIGLIQSLMHQPDVLILDEPTSGLDPLMQEVFFETIEEAKGRGAAVFVSSHNLTEAQRMCDRIGIIKHGQMIREQSIQDIDAQLTLPRFVVVLATAADIHSLRSQPALRVISSDGTSAEVQPVDSIAAALQALAKHDIKSIMTKQENLEDEFLEYYEESA